MPQIDWSKNPKMVGTDFNFSCIICACNHTHIAKYDGRTVRVCYECGEILENDVK